VQWYGNVPALGNVMENWPCGGMAPEFHTAPSDVDVCVVESVFVQVTVVPAVTSMASGLKARLPRIEAPLGMLTAVAELGVAGVGVGEGDGAE